MAKKGQTYSVAFCNLSPQKRHNKGLGKEQDLKKFSSSDQIFNVIKNSSGTPVNVAGFDNLFVLELYCFVVNPIYVPIFHSLC